MILATETPDMDCNAVGDLHLPPARRAYGRMQIRKTVLDDFNKWDEGILVWTRKDSCNPVLDTVMAARWLTRKCGRNASVKRYLTTWNGGPSGYMSKDAQNYYRRCLDVQAHYPDHFKACLLEVQARSNYVTGNT